MQNQGSRSKDDDAEVNRLYETMLKETLTPPDIMERLLSTQTIAQKKKFVAFQLQQSSTRANARVWSEKDLKQLQKLQQSQEADLASLTLLKVSLTTASKEYLHAFFQHQGLHILMTVMLKLVNHATVSVLDAATLYECCLCWKLIMNNGVGIQKVLQTTGALDVIAMCVLFQHKPLALLALEILSVTAFSPAATSTVLQALKVLARRSISGGHTSVNFGRFSTSSVTSKGSPFKPSGAASPSFSSSAMALSPLISSLVSIDLELKCAVFDLLLQLLLHCEQGSEEHGQLIVELESYFHLKDAIIPQIIQQIEHELQLLQLDENSGGAVLPIQSPASTSTTGEIIPRGSRLSMALTRYQSNNTPPATVRTGGPTANNNLSSSSHDEKEFMKILLEKSDDLTALRFLLPMEMETESTATASLSNVSSLNVLVLHTKEKLKRKGMFFLRTKVKRSVHPEEMVATIQDDFLTILQSPSSKERTTDGNGIFVKCGLVDILDMRTFTLDGDILHYSSEHQYSLLELVLSPSNASLLPQVVSLAFTSHHARDSFLQFLHKARDIRRLQRSTYGQLLFNSSLTNDHSEVSSSLVVNGTGGIYQEAFRMLRRFYRAMHDYESFLRSERERRRLSMLAVSRSPSTRVKFQQSFPTPAASDAKDNQPLTVDTNPSEESKGIVDEEDSAESDSHDGEESTQLTEDDEGEEEDTISAGRTSMMSMDDETVEGDSAFYETYENEDEYHERFMQLAMFLEKEWLSCDVVDYGLGERSEYGTMGHQNEHGHRSLLLMTMKRLLSLPPLDSCPGLDILIQEQLKYLHQRAFHLYNRYQQFPQDVGKDDADEENSTWWEKLSFRLEDVIQRKLSVYERFQGKNNEEEEEDFDVESQEDDTDNSDKSIGRKGSKFASRRVKTNNALIHEQAYRRMAQLAQQAIATEQELKEVKATLAMYQQSQQPFSPLENSAFATKQTPPVSSEVDTSMASVTKTSSLPVATLITDLRNQMDGMLVVSDAGSKDNAAHDSSKLPVKHAEEIRNILPEMQSLLHVLQNVIKKTESSDSSLTVEKQQSNDKVTVELQDKLKLAEEEIARLKLELSQQQLGNKPSSEVESASSEPSKFAKYEKMKKMLPEGAVRQKMAMDNFSDEDIDAFFSGKYLTAAVTAPASSSEAPPSAESSAKPQENRFSKYEKMKKMLPEGAVRQKMAMDNVSEADIELFISGKYLTSEPTAPVQATTTTKTEPQTTATETRFTKYEKMKKMLPEGAVRQKMSMEGMSDADIELFFSGKYLTEDAAAPTAAASATVVKADNRFEKFEKMKKMLPEGAVRQKMAMDGFSEADIELFMSGKYLTESSPPPAVASVASTKFAKYESMKKMLPEGAVRQKMSMDGLSEADIESFFSGKYLTVSTSTETPPAVAAKENRFEKFEKMKKMLPEGAVRQKMSMDGFSEADIELFMSGKYLDANAGSDKQNDNKQAILDKYTKMRRMLPEGAVRQKMLSDNILSPEEIDLFFFPKKSPPNSPLQGAKAGTKPTVVPAGPKKSVTKPMYWVKISCVLKEYTSKDKKFDKLRQLETIWQEILRKWHSDLMRSSASAASFSSNKLSPASSLTSFTNINVNALCVLPPPVQEWLETWFANPPPASAAAKKAPAKPSASSSATENKLLQAKKHSIVDSKRAQNILIVLGRVRRSPLELKRLILQLRTKTLTSELTANLRNILPTPEELQQLPPLVKQLHDMHLAKQQQQQQQTGTEATPKPADHSDLWIIDYVDLPTSFLYFMSTVPHISQRLQCHELIFHWSHNTMLLQNQFALLQTACDEITQGWDAWQGLLGVILALGNAMNAGNTKFGDAQAVKLDVLEKLATMKCTVLPPQPTSATNNDATATATAAATSTSSIATTSEELVPLWRKLKPTNAPATTFLHFLAMVLTFAEDACLTTQGIASAANVQLTVSTDGNNNNNNNRSTFFTFSPSHTQQQQQQSQQNQQPSSSSTTSGAYAISVKKHWLTSLTTHWKALWAVPEVSVKQLFVDLQQVEQQVQFAEEQLAWCKKQSQSKDKSLSSDKNETKEETPATAETTKKTNDEDDAEEDDGYKQRLETFLSDAKPLLLRVKAQITATEDNIAVLMAKFAESYYEGGNEGSNNGEESTAATTNTDPAQRFFKILVQFAQQLTLAAEDNTKRLAKIIKQEKQAAEVAKKLALREQRQKSKLQSVRFTSSAVSSKETNNNNNLTAANTKANRKSVRRVPSMRAGSETQNSSANDGESNNLFNKFHAQQRERDHQDEHLLVMMVSPTNGLGALSPKLGTATGLGSGLLESAGSRSPSRSPVMSLRFPSNRAVSQRQPPLAPVAPTGDAMAKETKKHIGLLLSDAELENTRAPTMMAPAAHDAGHVVHAGTPKESQRAAEYRANMIKSVRFAKPPSLR